MPHHIILLLERMGKGNRELYMSDFNRRVGARDKKQEVERKIGWKANGRRKWRHGEEERHGESARD